MRLVAENASSEEPARVDPDEDIIPAMMARDERAFAMLVDRHMKSIHSLANYMLQDPVLAEDVTQSVFLKTWQHMPNWTPGRAKLITWIRRVARNHCLDMLKKKGPIYTDEVPEMADERTEAFDKVSANEQEHIVATGLAKLPESQRFALTLSYYQNVAQREGAEIMGISIAAYESLLVRARKALRIILQGPVDMNGGI